MRELKRPEIIRVRSRSAPRPRAGAGIGGFLDWELIDRRGRAVAGGQQPNMFLDAGLNALAATALTSQQWFTHAAVGTGSNEPDVTQTALDSEVARTGTFSPGGNGSVTRVSDGVYHLTRTWQFDFSSGNGNLTEWGIARSSSGGLVVRQLFRDSQGTPITITKTDEFQLRIKYTCEIALADVLHTPGSLVIDGIGEVAGNYFWTYADDYNVMNADLAVFAYAAAGHFGSTNDKAGWGVAGASVPSGYGGKDVFGNSGSFDESRSASEFTAGIWSRSRSSVFGVGSSNGRVANLSVSARTHPGNGSAMGGFTFVIDEADRFTKDNEHVLSITDLLTVTWGRTGELE